MPILSLDDAAGTVRHQCALCGYEDDLALDPAAGHLQVAPHGETLVTRPCPHCAQHGVDHDGAPLVVVECFRLNIPSWEAGETPHPGSLVGTKLPGPRGITTNVVSEHTVGYHLSPERVQQVRLIRAMQQHPHLAPHAPLRPDPPHLPGHPAQRWDGTWRPNASKGGSSAPAAAPTTPPQSSSNH
jgi:hypothetical protein